jgi:hypothetical protein
MGKNTITSIFMVPTLQIPKNTLRENGFINAYSKDTCRDVVQYNECIYLLFRPEDIELFREWLNNEYERTEQVIEDYDYNGGFVVIVYKLDMKYKADFDLVKQGKYSKTSKKFQDVFPKVLKITKNGLHRDELSLQYRVFNKTNDMVEYWQEKLGISEWDDDFELWEGYDEAQEELSKKVLKKLRDEKSK